MIMKNLMIYALFLLFCSSAGIAADEKPGKIELPVRGLCIAAPSRERLDEFIQFISDELAPRKVNTLILRVDFGYQYTSHPELNDEHGLSREDVKKLVNACKEENINLIPQLNLLGHQSWAGRLNNLLRVYPQFDETPWVQMPEKYEWPNADGLYCKSYCPLHPEVHSIVFDLVDELCDVFECTAFHAGMDEVFYLGEEKCPRCSGYDHAELFAGEIRKIRDHLAGKNRELWIWGDRLIDGKTTGMGMWEASFNNTYRAIDLIPKDVFICDWHYERPEPTAVYFAAKGFRVAACPWRKPETGVQQVRDMASFRKFATPEMKDRYCGVIQTVWSDAGSFMEEIKARKSDENEGQGICFKRVFEEMR
jgi:hypothetical protein